MASPATKRSSPAFPALRPHGTQSGVLCRKTRLGRGVGEAGAGAGRPSCGGFGRNRSFWGLACSLAAGRASSPGGQSRRREDRGGCWARGPPSQPAPVCQTGEVGADRQSWRGAARSPMALVRGRDWNQQASCHADPPAPPGRPPGSRRDSRSSSLYAWVVWDAAGQGNTRTNGDRGKTRHIRVTSGETHGRTWAASKAVHFRDFLAILSH